MVESSDDPPLLDRIRSKAHVFGLGPRKAERPPVLPVSSAASLRNNHVTDPAGSVDLHHHHHGRSSAPAVGNSVAGDEKATPPPPAAPPPGVQERQGEDASAIEPPSGKRGMISRFFQTAKEILTYSIMNLLLVFVPVGIAVNYAGVNPSIIFAINAIALIPLAGLLAHATEAVAFSLGDTVGALLNVTFGNAVELIVFIIALTGGQIRIVQASIVGSILSNLLLILGMSFALGGLRFREQVYNSTVTQTSACLLSLSVTSLLLPTAFHASFANDQLADDRVLQLSRGSAVILLLIYILYLLFQLKSHSYLYVSTPQHVIDEESHPGVLANVLNNSSSDSSSSSESDSDSSSGSSHRTAKRIKRAITGGMKKRKSSTSSKDPPSMPSTARSQSIVEIPDIAIASSDGSTHQLGAIASGDEADADEGRFQSFPRNRSGASGSNELDSERFTKSKKKYRKNRKRVRYQKNIETSDTLTEATAQPKSPTVNSQPSGVASTAVEPSEKEKEPSSKRPLNLRTLSVRPAMPKFLGSTVFSETNPTGGTAPAGVSVPRAPYGLRRTSSLPDRLNRSRSQPSSRSEQRASPEDSVSPFPQGTVDKGEVKKYMSRTSAVVLLVITTGLVALCAEYLVGSIDYMVENTSLSQVFIGLIILPLVGNAAEHVTAVTVAMKNKMDLAIGIAVGSSIQIALFVTPLVVILGWCLNEQMSLYFSLFETIALFVSAFIINFLILDGRSNYLEGALLIAAYVIIAVAAFFYPSGNQQSEIGGYGTDPARMMA